MDLGNGRLRLHSRNIFIFLPAIIFGSYLEAVITFKIVNEDNVYRINNDEIRYTFFSKETGTRWRFKSNKPKELLVGNPVYSDNPYRTCLSKNVLEKKIKNILNRTSNG